jgi:hypothetical protein
MAVGSNQYTVGTAAVLLAQAPSGSASGPVANVLVANGSGTAVLLGGARVASGTGYSLATSSSVSIPLYSGDVLYGITASSTSTVSVLQT